MLSLLFHFRFHFNIDQSIRSEVSDSLDAPQQLYFSPSDAASALSESTSSSLDISDDFTSPPPKPAPRNSREKGRGAAAAVPPTSVSFSKRDGSPDISLSLNLDEQTELGRGLVTLIGWLLVILVTKSTCML